METKITLDDVKYCIKFLAEEVFSWKGFKKFVAEVEKDFRKRTPRERVILLLPLLLPSGLWLIFVLITKLFG